MADEGIIGWCRIAPLMSTARDVSPSPASWRTLVRQFAGQTRVSPRARAERGIDAGATKIDVTASIVTTAASHQRDRRRRVG